MATKSLDRIATLMGKHLLTKCDFFFVEDVLQERMTTYKTVNKKRPSPEVEEIMKRRLGLEYDFYTFVKERFRRQKAELGLRTAAWN